jgi:chromosome segregation ATPase
LADQVRARRERSQALQTEIDDLQKQGAIPYPREVGRMQERLRPIVGGKPKLLCELLEVSDPRWQNAVEAMLGRRRFNLVVAPERFHAAARELDRARAEERLYDVGLIDLAAAQRDGRPAQPGSLATRVQTPTAAVRAYIDAVLGDIIACEAVDELGRHRRAVTPEVVAYGEFTVRAVRPETYTPNCTCLASKALIGPMVNSSIRQLARSSD